MTTRNWTRLKRLRTGKGLDQSYRPILRPTILVFRCTMAFCRGTVRGLDHERVRLHLQDTSTVGSSQRKQHPVIYPIPTTQTSRLIEELLDGLTAAQVGHAVTGQTWDRSVQQCVNCIQRFRTLEKHLLKSVICRI